MLLISAERWSNIFILLSMDQVSPSFGLMGLYPDDAERFIHVLRTAILQHQSAHLADPEAPSFFVPGTLEALSKELGEPFCLELLQWGRHLYRRDDEDHIDLYRWWELLRACLDDRQRWSGLDLPPQHAHDFEDAVSAIREGRLFDSVRRGIPDAPLSDWDLAMFVLRAYDEDPTSSQSPEYWIRETAKTRLLRDLWHRVALTWTADEQRRFQRSATEIARKLGGIDQDVSLLAPEDLGYGYA